MELSGTDATATMLAQLNPQLQQLRDEIAQLKKEREKASRALALQDKDPHVAGQQFAVISVVFVNPEPETRAQRKVRLAQRKSKEVPRVYENIAVKIRGVFATELEAQQFASALSEIDTQHNLLVAPMYKWMPLPPDPLKIADHRYHEERLQMIMDGYQAQQRMSRRAVSDRQRAATTAAENVTSKLSSEKVAELDSISAAMEAERARHQEEMSARTDGIMAEIARQKEAHIAGTSELVAAAVEAATEAAADATAEAAANVE
jgi:hypothetical protein